MNVDLSDHEVKLLDRALECWERDPCREAMMESIMGAVLGASRGERPNKATMKSGLLAAEVSSQNRRIQATMLRAKLFQVLSRASEHNVVPENPMGGGNPQPDVVRS